MSKTVEFHFDFASPNAYLSHCVIPGIEARTGATFRYVPVLLGGVFKLTNNVAPMVTNKDVKGKGEYQMLEFRRFLQAHGIAKFKMNPHFPVNTLAMMRGAAAAEIDGSLQPYAAAMFHHMWEAGKKMDDMAVLSAALTESGLDAATIMARAQDADAKERLVANTQASVDRGNFGSPTFFVGSEMYFGKDRLRDVEDLLKRMA